MERTRHHDSGVPSRRPVIIAGASASTLGTLSIPPQQAVGVGIHALDLDLRAAWRCPSVESIRSLPTLRVHSVWLPMQYAGPGAEHRTQRLRGFLNFAATRCGLRTIVLPRNQPVRYIGIPLGSIARQMADLYGIRIALSIPADDVIALEGSHLEHVANMRRLAEEWDLDIALDLSSPHIDAWEAEAVLMRLFPRLTLVRMQTWLDRDGLPFHRPSARVCMRSASMLADQAYRNTISIEAWGRSALDWARPARPGLREAMQTRADIIGAYERVARVEGPRRRQSSEPEPRP